MGPISASTVVDQPRERVFDFVCDLANREAFCDHFITELRLERVDSAGAGAAARFKISPPLTTMWFETVIEDAERPHQVYERGHGGRLDRMAVNTVWEMVAGPAGSTELRLSFWTEPTHPLDRLRERLGAARWYRRQWSRALGRLREMIETDAEVKRVGIAGEDRVPVAPR